MPTSERDGQVDASDDDAFKMLLSEPATYAAEHPDCNALLGILDGGGVVDESDYELFAALVGTSTPQAVRLSYDAENRVTQAWRFDGSNLQIWYDALGRRILTAQTDAAENTTFIMHVYDGLTPVAEYEWNFLVGEWALAREFLWGSSGISEPGAQATGSSFPHPLTMIDHTAAGDKGAAIPETLYYVHDALGSVVGLLDDPVEANIPAKLVERYDYDPYGTTYISCRQGQTFVSCETSRYGNPFLWTAQRYDAAVGLYHFLFRTYSPTLGRWMQRDPAGYVDGVSLYEYVKSKPIGLVDPFGLDAPGDKWYGFDKLGGDNFKHYVHRIYKNKGDSNLTPEEMQDAYDEFVEKGEPDKDGKPTKPPRKLQEDGDSTNDAPEPFVDPIIDPTWIPVPQPRPAIPSAPPPSTPSSIGLSDVLVAAGAAVLVGGAVIVIGTAIIGSGGTFAGLAAILLGATAATAAGENLPGEELEPQSSGPLEIPNDPSTPAGPKPFCP